METQKIEELRKKMFKAPNKDEINEIVEEYQTAIKDLITYKRLGKAKDEKELDKLIFEGIENGSITKEDWYPAPKNEAELHDKEKNHFYLTEAMIEEAHTNKIWEKIQHKISDEEKEEIYLYTKNGYIVYYEAKNIEEFKKENIIEYQRSQECHQRYLNFIREDKTEKFAKSQIEDYTTLKENNTLYLKDKSLNKKTYDFENQKFPIILEVADEFSNYEQNHIIERLNLMLKYEKIKDPKIIEEIKKITKEFAKEIQEVEIKKITNDKEFTKEIQELKNNFNKFSNPNNIEELKQYSQQSIDYELKKEFANTQKASLLYTDIQKNQHKFQYYTPKAKQQFLNKIMDLKELKDYMPKEAIEKMQETTKNISKQLENGLTR